MKRLTLIITVALLIGVLSGCGDASQKTEVKDELVVGMELAYPPFEMTDENGEPTGISVDLAHALGEHLGKSVRIENMSYGGLIPALKTNKIDLIISSMTITEERKETVEFSDPYSKSYLSLLINKESPVQKFEDLNKKGRKIAVKKGTTGHIYATEHLPNTEVLVFEKQSACVLEVVQGKADAFIYDQMTIFKNWKQYPNSTRALLEPFQEEFEYWGMAMRKDEGDLKEKANKFIKEYKEKGEFEKLALKYLEEQKKVFDELGIPFFF